MEKGYLNAADLVTTKASATKDKKGVYGKISAEAFGRFQIATNVTVKGGTGYKRAGPGSRSKIKELSCGTPSQALTRSGVTTDVGSIMRLSGGVSAVTAGTNGNLGSMDTNASVQAPAPTNVDVAAVFKSKAKLQNAN